jgi:hypothetical protein
MHDRQMMLSGCIQAGFGYVHSDERLLTLALIWRWREQKRLDATGDQANFEKAFAEAAGMDKGARVIRSRRRALSRARIAWPWELG